MFQYATEDCVDFIRQCLIKDQDLRPSVDELLEHPWLNQDLLGRESIIETGAAGRSQEN